MSIKHNMLINLLVFIIMAGYLCYHELYTFHPDALKFLDMKM